MERGVKRRQRRRSPLPFLLLAVAVVGCAFAVAVAAVVPMEADSPGGQDQAFADKQGFAGKGKTKAEISQSEDGQTRPTREEHRKTPRRSGGARSVRTLGNGYSLQREADFKKSPSCADGAEDAAGNYRAYAGSDGGKHYKGT